MMELETEEVARQKRLLGQKVADEKKPGPAKAAEDGLISIDEFAKVDLRVGIVKDAAPLKGADKLLHLHVDIGEPEPRSIVAGIALAYKPEELLGRKVVIVANLAPRKLRGVLSQGMIVAASREGDVPVLASFLEDVPVGARLK
jgi:methionyl-tRNA synthetase